MRFKEFFTEQSQLSLTPKPGYKGWRIDNNTVVYAPATMDANAVNASLQADPSVLQPPAQAASITPPVTPPPTTTDTLPPGYREFKLPNGTLTAVPQQLDDKQAMDLIKRKRPDLLGPVAQSMTPKKSTRVTIPADLPALPTVDLKLSAKAKQVADAYLGRAMTPQEWDHLIRATYAESGHSEKEDAHIMATILNRARHGGFGGTNISKVLASPQQFQSVTGTSAEPGMANTFTQGPPKQSLSTILNGVIKHLPKVSKDIGYFTSNKEAAYKAGTNKDFLKNMKKSGGNVIGQSVFAKMDPEGHMVKQPTPPTKIAKK